MISDLLRPQECATPEQPENRQHFDLWLNKKLHMLYGPVVNEPLPEDLIEIIEAHKGKGGA